jgi:1,4-alpha-glucan branching enzyme
MENSRMSRDSDVFVPGSGGTVSEIVETSPKPLKTSDSHAGKSNPQPAIQPVSERFPALEEQEIFLTLFAPEAREVTVAGVFNSWRPEVTPLEDAGAGEWVVRLPLRSGQYEYRFVVDGRWREDPRASQRAATPYGGFNSVLQVPLAVRTTLL